MEVDLVVLSEAVAATSLWSEPSVIVGIVTAGLFICVLTAQIFATIATFRAANAAKASVELATTEANLRLAPFISVPDILSFAVKDKADMVLTRRDLQSGEVSMDVARSKGEPETIIYRIEIKNSGTIAAVDVGHGIGQDFDRAEALKAMRADTGHSGTLVPPATSITHDIDIPIDAVTTAHSDREHPYFVAFSVAYKDHRGRGFLVEVEWEHRGSQINTLRHSAPEPYSGETIPSTI